MSKLIKNETAMKKLHVNLGILTALAMSTLSITAWADNYDISFTAATSDATVATGQITVLDGVAVGGTLDVTSGPDSGNYTLVTGSGGDSSFVYDNLVDPASDVSFIDSTGGLLWSVSGILGNNTEMNLWFNPVAEWGAPADSYSLWGGDSGNYSLEAYGTASLSPAHVVSFAPVAPASAADGGWTLGLLVGALAGLEVLRRNLAC
jgi:hypothetical protein